MLSNFFQELLKIITENLENLVLQIQSLQDFVATSSIIATAKIIFNNNNNLSSYF